MLALPSGKLGERNEDADAGQDARWPHRQDACATAAYELGILYTSTRPLPVVLFLPRTLAHGCLSRLPLNSTYQSCSNSGASPKPDHNYLFASCRLHRVA